MNAIFQFPDSSKGSDFLTNSVIHKQKPQEGTPLHHYNVYRIWIWPKIFFSNLHTFSSEVNGQYSEEGRLNESSVVSWVPNVAVTVLPASLAYHEPRLNPGICLIDQVLLMRTRPPQLGHMIRKGILRYILFWNLNFFWVVAEL